VAKKVFTKPVICYYHSFINLIVLLVIKSKTFTRRFDYYIIYGVKEIATENITRVKEDIADAKLTQGILSAIIIFETPEFNEDSHLSLYQTSCYELVRRLSE
jgi:hypothetical protein